ncbi:MAG: phosphotransferase, partial [Nannocystaceae bacterium]
VEVTPELACTLIGEQFPSLRPVHATPYGAGWDNTAYLVNDRYVFRFPHRAVAVPLLAAECRVLPAIAKNVHLQIPAPMFVGKPSPRFAWPFAGAPEVPGQTACRARLSPRQRARQAQPLARFLAALHRLTPAEVPGVGHDHFHRSDLARRIPQVYERLAEARQRGLVGYHARYEAILEAVPMDAVMRTDVLVHGDLYARHLIVDPRGDLTGVIDWGDAHRGDPHLDLALAHSFLPPRARAVFLETYRACGDGSSIDPHTWELARYRSLYSSLTIAVYGHDIGDAALCAEGQWALANLLAD